LKSPRLLFIVSVVLLAVIARLIPHPFNFTPVGAAALFAGATLKRKGFAFLVPLVAMLLSDAVLGFHSGMPVIYVCFAATVCIGFVLRNRTRSPLSLLAGATSGATLFFIVTNFFVWTKGTLYAHTLAGLAACYVAAIPFYGNQLAGDAVYTAVLFGGLALVEHRFPMVAEGA
jgi:hypothetical protein